MKKPWSISTTVRNPYRLRDFLSVLQKLEGQPFNSDNQIKYQTLLIQSKFYEPNHLTAEQKAYFDDIEKEMPFSTAREIFSGRSYKDPAMRGRNSVAQMNKMGLCIARNSAPEVVITPLGKYFLSEDYDLGRLFFIHFLKWQLPNPASREFSRDDGFNIKPFIGVLHLIKKVNELWMKAGNNPVGITKDEFSLFVPTLIHHEDIEKQAERLIDYRAGLNQQGGDEKKKHFKDTFRKDFAETFLGTNTSTKINKLLQNLKDYGDNTIRYFRLTRFLYIRGGGFYVDLEPRRSIEIGRLLSTDNASSLEFENADKYIGYLADLDQPTLPWETRDELEKIAHVLNKDIQERLADLDGKAREIPSFDFQKTEKLSIKSLNLYIERLRNHRRQLQDIETHFSSQDVSKIREYLDAFKGIHKSSKRKGIELERLSALALNALNDALEIRPNYPVGDDNEPTCTAPGNKPDIECFYEQFNSVCEVTMLTDRSQWYHEGQPVMRHVRKFEEAHIGKTVYCLFIAPKLHPDTIETFWMAVKHGYRGATQKIVPLSIPQFSRLLESLLEIREQGKHFPHGKLLDLYEDILKLTDHVAHSDNWIKEIPGVITAWQKQFR